MTHLDPKKYDPNWTAGVAVINVLNNNFCTGHVSQTVSPIDLKFDTQVYLKYTTKSQFKVGFSEYHHLDII